MPVTPTYPGIYIEEVRSNAHSITAAATSIAVFVGYTHPFKTNPNNWGKAVRVFSFSDFERECGGFFNSDRLTAHVAHAVNNFFLNGGSDAYVVPLQPHFYDMASGTPVDKGAMAPAEVTIGGIRFIALEPTDAHHPMSITINNLQPSDPLLPLVFDLADIQVTYGSRAETFRKVQLKTVGAENIIEQRIGTAAKPVSSLISVAPVGGAVTSYVAAVNQIPLGYPNPPFVANYPLPGWTTYNPADFAPVFEQDQPLDKVPIFNLMVLPGISDNAVWSAALAFCERKQAFLIMDAPRDDSADGAGGLTKVEDTFRGGAVPKSPNGAFYFPWLLATDPLTGVQRDVPPSGYVAGIYARTDTNRGVWKAPAGLETTVLNTSGVVERGRMTDMRQGTLNPIGVNCLRDFPGIGTVIFGARTLVAANPAFEQFRYVPVRRMTLFLEQTLLRNLTWVIFEPNDEPLWVAIRTSIEAFMLSLFRQGAFQGTMPSQAFQVTCDKTTTTQTDIDNGIVNIVVAFAPLKPAEFVIVKIAQLAGQAQV